MSSAEESVVKVATPKKLLASFTDASPHVLTTPFYAPMAGFVGAVFSVELSKKSPLHVWFVDEFSNSEYKGFECTNSDRIRMDTLSVTSASNRPKAVTHKFGYYRKYYRRNGVNDYTVLMKKETGSFYPTRLRFYLNGLDNGAVVKRVIWAGVYSPYSWLIPHLIYTYSWI